MFLVNFIKGQNQEYAICIVSLSLSLKYVDLTIVLSKYCEIDDVCAIRDFHYHYISIPNTQMGSFRCHFCFLFFDKVLFQSEKSILIGGDS